MFMTDHVTRRTRFTTIASGLALCFLASGTAKAAIFNIADGDVAGLIAAIQTANASGGSNIINLAPSGTYTLTTVAADDGYSGAAGLPYITSPLTINGQGATIQRSSAAGTPNFRIIFVFVSNLTLDGVTITGGNGGNGNRGGGGLGMTASTALVRNSTITGNYGINGGGIYLTSSALTIENSTVSYNTGYGGYGGGGILNFVSTTTISFSTVFENRADGAPGFQGRGDSIADAFSPQGSITVKNSILASPTLGLGTACVFFTPNSLGHNIAGDNSCGLTWAGDMNSTNPLLGPTANNGGPTPTDLPLLGSPAIDAVPLAYCSDAFGVPVTNDQRGITRPQGPACDIGSVEAPPADTTPPVITPTITGTQGANGWYISNVTVTWSVTDPESGITSSSGCATAQLSATASLMCSAVNGANLSTSYPLTVRIDQTPPVISAPTITGTLGANGWYTSDVTVGWSTNDPESGIVTPACGATVNGNTAGTTVTCNATNGAGLSSSSSLSVKIDQSQPAIAGMPAPGCKLWPPDNKLVQVATISASAGISGLTSFNVTATSSEPTNPGPDIVITGTGLQPRTVQLRATRLGDGNGRVYTISAAVSNGAGVNSTSTAICTVPHDQGN